MQQVLSDPRKSIKECLSNPNVAVYRDGEYTDELDTECSWEHLGIKSGDILHLKQVDKEEVINIFIHPFGEARFPEATLAVLPTDTIDELKRKISESSGISVDHQRLLFNKSPLTNGAISENRITDYSEVILFKVWSSVYLCDFMMTIIDYILNDTNAVIGTNAKWIW